MTKRKRNSGLNYGSLEPRQVLTTNPVVSLAGGVIDIQGTELRDIVRTVERDDSVHVLVQAQGQAYDVYRFASEDVTSISFSGKDGDDLFVNRTAFSSTAYGNNGNDWLLGGSGDDVLRGGAGNDNIRGFAGDDSLHGDHGNDRLAGQEGNDRLLGWYGNDVLIGGFGNDYVSGYLGDDILYGGDGDDILKGHEGRDFLGAGDGDDFLYGWKGNDHLFGGAGDDYLSGYHGNDILAGNDGDDIIKGHEGNDRLFGGDGDDNLYGWKGVDRMNGGNGSDELWGGSENDIMAGAAGDDILHGDHGDDTLYGGEGNDILVGYYGNDRLLGGAGGDMLCGGYDKDTYVAVDSEDVGYDPDGEFSNTPGVDQDKVLEQELQEEMDLFIEDFRERSDKIASALDEDLQAVEASLVDADEVINPRNLLINGSFEDNPVKHVWGVFQEIPGWQTSSGEGLEVQVVGNSAFDGRALVELDSHDFGGEALGSNSGMFQDVLTTEGVAYKLSVQYSARPRVAEASNGVEIYFNGELLATMSADGVGLAAPEFNKFTFTVTGTGKDRVEFRAVGKQDSLGGLIDDVRLTIS